jgi:hypothetical protein
MLARGAKLARKYGLTQGCELRARPQSRHIWHAETSINCFDKRARSRAFGQPSPIPAKRDQAEMAPSIEDRCRETQKTLKIGDAPMSLGRSPSASAIWHQPRWRTGSMSYRRLSEKGKLSGPQEVNETLGCLWLTTQSTEMLRVGLYAVCPSRGGQTERTFAPSAWMLV